MNGTTLIHSEFLFGSSARGDDDQASDKDVLIVSNAWGRISHIKEKYSNDGYSVSFYPPSVFAKMCESGSLFVKHIKDEGIEIIDSSHWLKNLLETYTPKKSYAEDLKLFNQVLFTLIRFKTSNRMRMFCADILHTYLRSYSIMTMAENGYFAFSTQIITSFLQEKFRGQFDFGDIFPKLRKMKKAYREGARQTTGFEDIVDLLLLNYTNEHIAGNPPLEYRVGAAPRLLTSAYATLRDIESRLVSSDIEVDATSEIERAFNLVRKPNEYRFQIKQIDQEQLYKIEASIRKIESQQECVV